MEQNYLGITPGVRDYVDQKIAESGGGGGGEPGPPGPEGPPGPAGKSAYEIYAESVENPMSEEEWLASLKGEKGDKGDDATIDTSQFATKDELSNYVPNSSTQKDCMTIQCPGIMELNATTGNLDLTSMWDTTISGGTVKIKSKIDNVSSTIDCRKDKINIEHTKMIDIVSQDRVTLLCGVHMADFSNEMFDVTSPKMKVRGTLVNGEDKEYATKEYVDQQSGGGGIDPSQFATKEDLDDYTTKSALRMELEMISKTYAAKTELSKYIPNTSTTGAVQIENGSNKIELASDRTNFNCPINVGSVTLRDVNGELNIHSDGFRVESREANLEFRDYLTINAPNVSIAGILIKDLEARVAALEAKVK